MPEASPVSLETIRVGTQKKFPIGVLRGVQSAICFFGATSGGRNELIHILDTGIKDVSVVDHRSHKIKAVRKIFPVTWKYISDDSLKICAKLLQANQRFDLVVCDGSSGIVDHIWEDLFPYFYQIANKRLLIRITGAFINDYLNGVQVSKQTTETLTARLFGCRIPVSGLIKRSSGQGGTYWTVIDVQKKPTLFSRSSKNTISVWHATSGSAPTREISRQCAMVTDLWGETGCPRAPRCASIINSFRRECTHKERQSIFRVYTTPRWALLSKRKIEDHRYRTACFDLDRFDSIEAGYEAARRITNKKGTINRKIKKAENLGYYVKPFDKRTHIPDIHAIHFSKTIRGGKPLRDTYHKTIEEMGGYPKVKYSFETPGCRLHYRVPWGVFIRENGHKQGSITTNERLVGYVGLVRYGNHCWYSRIMGHGEHLGKNIMYLLHFRIVEALLQEKPTGLRYIFYGGWQSGPKSGSLTQWKRHCLFEPKFILYDEAGDWKAGEGPQYR